MTKELRIPVFVDYGDRLLGFTIYSSKSGGQTTMYDELTGGWEIFIDKKTTINEIPLAIGVYLQAMLTSGKDKRIYNVTHDNGDKEVLFILEFHPNTEAAKILYSLPKKEE